MSLKYFLRLSDNFSFFLGGKGRVSLWQQQVEPNYEPDNADGFISSYSGLYTNYEANLMLNAAVIAGLRYIPFTYGFIEPHAANRVAGQPQLLLTRLHIPEPSKIGRKRYLTTNKYCMM